LPSTFAHVAEHEHHSGDFTVRMANRSGAVVNRAFRAVFGDEQRVVCQTDNHAFAQGTGRGVLHRPASFFVDKFEHPFQRNACRFLLPPAGQELSHGIQKSDAAFGVGGN
jgi:hypothetical protein